MQSENTAATDTDTPDGDPGAAPADISSLADLLANDDTPPEGGDQGAAAGNGNENTKPEMFNDIAETMGLELDDLYKLKVTTANGETVSIEELKSLQTKQDDIVLRELEFEETRASREGDLRTAQNELSQIVAALPDGTLTPAVLERLRTKNVNLVQVEQAKTLGAIPSWMDEAARTKDMTGMSAHLERFGFPANHLGTVVDHRQFVFIRESYLREQRIKKALERVRAGAPNPTTQTTGRAAGKTAAKPANNNARNGLEQFFSDVN